MKSPKAIIINPDERTRNQLKESLETHSLRFKVLQFPSYEAWHSYEDNSEKKAQIYLISHDLSPLGGIKIAEELASNYPFSARLLTNSPNQQSSKAIGHPAITYWIDTPVDSTRVHTILDILRAKKRIFQDLTIGIIGVRGRLGNDLLRELYGKGELHVYSNSLVKESYGKPNYSSELKVAGIPEGDPRVLCHNKLSSIINANLDAIIITTGEHITAKSLKEMPTRKQWFYKNLPYLKQILLELKGNALNSLVFIESNPPEPLMRVGVDVYGINPINFTSISADTERYRKVINRYLHSISGFGELKEPLPDLKPKNIELINFGEHGEDMPDLRTCKIKGKNLLDLLKEERENFPKELSKLLENEKQEIGTEVLEAVILKGRSYPDTPEVIARALDELAHFQEKPVDCWSCYHPEYNAFLQWPVKILYPSNKSQMKVLPDYERLSFENLDNEDRQIIEKQIKCQKQLVKNRNNPEYLKSNASKGV